MAAVKVQAQDLRKNLSAILDAVEAGEGIIIERRGRQIARLTPVGRSPLGAMRGEFGMTEGWEKSMSNREAEEFLSGH